jgi:HSP20 family protein
MNGRCDFEELDDKYIAELEVPGVKKDEINISVKNDTLTISWSRRRETKKGKGKTNYERSEGSFKRRFDVTGADTEKVEASLKDGILKIIIPKLENFKPKQIEIK